MGRVSASIPDSTKKYVSGVFKREHLRSFAVFFGIGEDRPFYLESTPSLLMDRLRHNAMFFYLNYLLLTAILFCLTLIISPSAIIEMALLAAAWMWIIRASQSGSLKIASEYSMISSKKFQANHFVVVLTVLCVLLDITIPQQTATIIMGVISIFVLLYVLSGIFWWTLFTSGFFVAVHAFMRDASLHKDMEDVVAMEGDMNIGGEDAAFLNVASVDQV